MAPGPSSGRCPTSSSSGPTSACCQEEADELRAKVETIGRQGVGGSSLTTAELRILPLLATHLTFREIAERLYLSPYTVEGQALSVYRKFGVSFAERGHRARARRRRPWASVVVGRPPNTRPGPARTMTSPPFFFLK